MKGGKFKMVKMTKLDFESYVEVRKNGITNMFDVSRVEELTGLEREQIFFIMKNYKALKEQYNV